MRKYFALISIFSIILQTFSGIFLYQPVFSQEEATPTPEIVATSISEPTVRVDQTTTPTSDLTLNPTSSPEPSTTPTEVITPTPTEEITPTVTPEVTPAPTKNPTDNQSNAPPQVAGDSTTPTPTENTPTPTELLTESSEIGHLQAIILKETSAASIDNLDLEIQSEGSATLITDKLDYAPTDTVLITGAGFLAGKTYTIYISSSDEPAVNYQDSVTADNNGDLFYPYQLDGTYRPDYKVEVKDKDSNVVIAATSFLDHSDPQITICHRSNSSSNPYGKQTVDDSAVDGVGGSDHRNHTGPVWPSVGSDGKWGDIIPPTDNSGNPTPGGSMNWTTQGQVIWNDDCKARPDLTISKTNNVNGNTTVGQAFTWTLTVSNIGVASAIFNNQDIIQDDLPDTNITYLPISSIPVSASGGVTGLIDCNIVSNTLDCDDNSGGDPVVIPAGESFSVSFFATPTSAGTFTNPRSGSGKKCKVDPDTNKSESNEDNNTCRDSIQVTNTGSITIIKDSQLDDPQDFSFTTTGSGLSSFSLDDDSDGTLSNTTSFSGLVAGAYTVTEGAATGWTLSNITCVDPTQNSSGNLPTAPTATINLAAGESVTCTFTNTQTTGSLLVYKVFTDQYPNDGIQINLTGTMTTSAYTNQNGDVTFTNLIPGTYTAHAVEPDGYYESDNTCVRVSVVAGQQSSCTITDTKFGHIIIQKSTDPAQDPQEFGLTLTGGDSQLNQNFQLQGGQSHDSGEILPSSGYSASETVPQGWDQTNANCDNGSSINDINVNPGQIVTCTFSNTKQGKVIVTKYEDANADGAYTAGDEQVLSDWIINLSGVGSDRTDGDGQVTFDNLIPGAYTLSENGKEDWYLSNINCDNEDEQEENDTSNEHSASVGAGETVNCKIGNYQKGHITVTKNVVGPNNQDVNDTSTNFTFNLIGQDPFDLTDGQSSPSFEADPATTYFLSEQTSDNYEFAGCKINGQPFEGINVASGQLVSVVCTNEQKQGSIAGLKWNDQNGNGRNDEEPGLSGWTIQLKDAQGEEVLDTATTDEETGDYRFENIIAGTYLVCEVPQEGWQRTQPANSDCQSVVVNPGRETTNVDFGNVRLGSIGDTVWLDANGNGIQDLGEGGILGVSINLYRDNGNDIFEPEAGDGSPVTLVTDADGKYLFENIIMGKYWVKVGTGVSAGYILTTFNDPALINLSAGENYFNADFGYITRAPGIVLAKTNDKPTASAGETVTYTLTLTNGDVLGNNITVIDVLPWGFSYIAGTSFVNGLLTEPTPLGNILRWNIESIDSNQTIIITYQAKISNSQPALTYYNIASCFGNTRLTQLTHFVPLDLYRCNLVASKVKIGRIFSFSTTISGTTNQVLGVSTGPSVLGAATGSPTELVFLAAIMISSGFILNKKKRIIKNKN